MDNCRLENQERKSQWPIKERRKNKKAKKMRKTSVHEDPAAVDNTLASQFYHPPFLHLLMTWSALHFHFCLSLRVFFSHYYIKI